MSMTVKDTLDQLEPGVWSLEIISANTSDTIMGYATQFVLEATNVMITGKKMKIYWASPETEDEVDGIAPSFIIVYGCSHRLFFPVNYIIKKEVYECDRESDIKFKGFISSKDIIEAHLQYVYNTTFGTTTLSNGELSFNLYKVKTFTTLEEAKQFAIEYNQDALTSALSLATNANEAIEDLRDM